MKKIVFAISTALLSFSSLYASGSTPKIVGLEETIQKLEEQLQKAVEELNTQLAAEAEKETLPIIRSVVQDSSLQQAVEEKLNKRLDELEARLIVLEKAKQDPLQGARTPEEAKATKEANEKAPKLQDTLGIAQYNLALGLLKNKELEKAKEAFEQLIKDHPTDFYVPKAWFHLGEIFRQLGDFIQAETTYQKALTYKLEEPIMVECRLGFIETLIGLNKMKSACEQVTILQKEQLDNKQKNRLQEAFRKASCQKEATAK